MSIALAMIVKDEEKVLRKCLDSVIGIVDECIILDTGSTDKTEDIAVEYGDFYTMAWVNETVCRQEAIALVKSDYVILIDADEYFISGVEKLKEYAKNDVDCVSCKIHDVDSDGNTTNVYDRIRMFKNNGNWEFNGSGAHGAVSGKGAITYDRFIIVEHSHKNRVRPCKNNSNIDILSIAVDKNPNDARSMFYLARTYKDNKDYKNAIKFYDRYLKLKSNYQEEVWRAKYDKAICVNALGDFMKALLECDNVIAYDPNRPEAYNFKGQILYKLQEFETAIYFFSKALNCFPDSNKTLFVDPRQYVEVPADNLSMCYYHIGNAQKAIEMANKVMGVKSYVDKRVLDNLKYFKNMEKT